MTVAPGIKRAKQGAAGQPVVKLPRIEIRMMNEAEREQVKDAARDADMTVQAYCRRRILGLPIV